MSQIEDITSFNQFLKYFGFQSTEHASIFHIYRCNTMRLHKDEYILTPTHRQHFFDITFITNANFTYHYSQYSEQVLGNCLQLVPPRQLQKLEAPASQFLDLNGFTLYFKPEFLSTYFDNRKFIRDFPFFAYSNTDVLFDLNVRETIEFYTLFEKIIQLYENRDAFSDNIIIGYLWALLNTIKKLWVQRKADKISTLKSDLVSQFETVVCENLKASVRVTDVADMLCLSPKYLSESLKAECGQSAREIIDERLLTEAKALLAQSALSISEVGYRLGFAEPSSFSRFFKRLSGLSPSEYLFSRNSVK